MRFMHTTHCRENTSGTRVEEGEGRDGGSARQALLTLIQLLHVGASGVLAAAQVAGAAAADEVVVALLLDLLHLDLTNVLAAARVAQAAAAAEVVVALLVDLLLGLALAAAAGLALALSTLLVGFLLAGLALAGSVSSLALHVLAVALVAESALAALEVLADLAGHVAHAVAVEALVLWGEVEKQELSEGG